MQADKKKHQAQEGPDVPHVEERDNVSGANGQAPAQEEPGTGIAQAEETPDVNKLKEQLDRQTTDCSGCMRNSTITANVRQGTPGPGSDSFRRRYKGHAPGAG